MDHFYFKDHLVKVLVEKENILMNLVVKVPFSFLFSFLSFETY